MECGVLRVMLRAAGFSEGSHRSCVVASHFVNFNFVDGPAGWWVMHVVGCGC